MPVSMSRNRRANGCTATPAANDSAVISPAKPADRVRALVTSSGSTTMARATEPNTSGLPGATASQNRRVRTAAGGQRRAVAGETRDRTRAGDRGAAPRASRPASPRPPCRSPGAAGTAPPAGRLPMGQHGGHHRRDRPGGQRQRRPPDAEPTAQPSSRDTSCTQR